MAQQEQVRLQNVLTGITERVRIRSSKSRYLQLETEEDSGWKADTPVEITTTGAIYLGVVESHEQKHLLIAVEHRIDKAAMEQIQSSWVEIESKP